MKLVHCKNKQCKEVVGQSDGLNLFDGLQPVNKLSCSKCGTVRKFHGDAVKPQPIRFGVADLEIRLS